jgi:hypothetical protein
LEAALRGGPAPKTGRISFSRSVLPPSARGLE